MVLTAEVGRRPPRKRGGGGAAAAHSSGTTHAFGDALALGEKHDIVAFDAGAKAFDGELRVDGESRFHLRARLVEPAEMGETGGEKEIRPVSVAVGVDRLSQPPYRCLVFAEIGLCQAGLVKPLRDSRVAGAQAQRLQDMSLGLLRLTNEHARKASAGPRARVIRI